MTATSLAEKHTFLDLPHLHIIVCYLMVCQIYFFSFTQPHIKIMQTRKQYIGLDFI